jgi:hypothetical protein
MRLYAIATVLALVYACSTEVRRPMDSGSEKLTEASIASDAYLDSNIGAEAQFDGTFDGDIDSAIKEYCDKYRCFTVVPTGQNKCYNDKGERLDPCPGKAGDDGCSSTAWCGQDAQYATRQRQYQEKSEQGDLIVEDVIAKREWQGGYSDKIDFDQASAYCDGLTYAGYTDWRLPTYYELLDTVNYGKEATDGAATDIPNTPEECFWSSTAPYKDSSARLFVDMNNGSGWNINKDGLCHARCTRGSEVKSDGEDRYALYGATELVAFDKATGLIWTWQKEEYTAIYNWSNALAYCEGLKYGGYNDWRLPNIDEIRSLIDTEVEPPRDPMLVGPTSKFPNIPSGRFWSSTTMTQIKYTDVYSEAWRVDFSLGEIWIDEKTTSIYALCVRQGA